MTTFNSPVAYETTDVSGRTCWVAEDPDIQGPYAIGDTADDAFQNLERALEVWRRTTRAREGGSGTSAGTSGGTMAGSAVFTFSPGESAPRWIESELIEV